MIGLRLPHDGGGLGRWDAGRRLLAAGTGAGAVAADLSVLNAVPLPADARSSLAGVVPIRLAALVVTAAISGPCPAPAAMAVSGAVASGAAASPAAASGAAASDTRTSGAAPFGMVVNGFTVPPLPILR